MPVLFKIKEISMILVNLALAVLVLAAALFLGAVGMALLKSLNEKPSDKNDQDKSA